MVGVSNGRGGLVGSGTNAPLYTTSFTVRSKTQENADRHEIRLAEALDLDRTSRVLDCREVARPTLSATISSPEIGKTSWNGTQWVMGGPSKSTAPALMSYIITDLPKNHKHLRRLEICQLRLSNKSISPLIIPNLTKSQFWMLQIFEMTSIAPCLHIVPRCTLSLLASVHCCMLGRSHKEFTCCTVGLPMGLG